MIQYFIPINLPVSAKYSIFAAEMETAFQMNTEGTKSLMLMQTKACLVLLILCCATTVKAQKPVTPKWQQWHYLSEKEMKTQVRAVEFVE